MKFPKLSWWWQIEWKFLKGTKKSKEIYIFELWDKYKIKWNTVKIDFSKEANSKLKPSDIQQKVMEWLLLMYVNNQSSNGGVDKNVFKFDKDNKTITQTIWENIDFKNLNIKDAVLTEEKWEKPDTYIWDAIAKSINPEKSK